MRNFLSRDKTQLSLLSRLKTGLKRTRNQLGEGLARVVAGKKTIDPQLLEDIENQLTTRDKLLVREGFLPPEPISDDGSSEFTFRPNESKGTATFHYFGPEINDVPALLEFCKIDLEVWEVVESELKKHQGHMKISPEGNIEEPAQVTNVNISVKLKKRKHEIAIKLVAASVLKQMEDHAFRYPKGRRIRPGISSTDPHLLEIAIVDPHIGALILASQTGKEYTPEQAATSIPWATEQLVNQSRGFELEKVVFLVGNDALHFDNYQRTTTHGTLMGDAGLSYDQAFVLAESSIIQSVDWLLANVAPVTLVVVKGNHDYASTFSLGRVLEAWYRNCPDVDFINTEQPRQYVEYGVNLIGFAHGDLGPPARSAAAMPDEAKEAWARTEIREIHHGHFHKNLTEEHGTTTIRFLPTLCPPNKWANDKGFTSRRGAHGFLFHRTQGQLGIFSTPIRAMRAQSAVFSL